jgi:ABC-2 type transport system permease protein
MLGHIAAFEWRYQLKSPVFWVGCLLFFLLAFGATTLDGIQIGSIGNVHKNSPYAILQTVQTMGVFGIFITVAMVAGVVLRDDETNFAPIIRATSVGKSAYLIGRFTGASAAAFLVLAMVPLAILVGSFMPWQDAEKIGAFRPWDYLFALFAFALPTLLITAAAFFALATATRSMMWTYVCAVGLLVLYIAARVALRDPQYDTITALLDPFGLSPLTLATKYWTASERNGQLPPLSGIVLENRLLWAVLGLALFGAAFRSFRFEMRFEKPAAGKSGRAAKADKGGRESARQSRSAGVGRLHKAELAALSETNPAGVREVMGADARRSRVALPDIPAPTAATRLAQLWELAVADMGFVFRSPAFFVLIAIGLVNAAASLWFSGDILGSPSYPVTRLIVNALNDSYSLMPIIIAIYYGGELVWRDRDRRVHEIVDATSAPDWARMLPKVLAIALVLLCSALAGVLAGVLVQALRGYLHFQVGAYLLWFVWPMTVGALLLAILSVFVQVLAPQKYVGWGLMLVYLVASVALGKIGFEHNLYNYGGSPMVPLSDMNGMGRFWIAQAWFHGYWLAFAVILLVISYALWRRGTSVALRPRLAQIGHRLRGRALAVLVVAALAWVGSGGWIYYNTNVLNRYVTQPGHDELMADLEKTLLPLEDVVQPRVAAVTLAVDLYPREPRAVTRGRYTLVNRSAQAIDALHLQWAENLDLDAIEFAGATVQTDYPRFHYRIYKLATPMQPGEQRVLGFTTTLQERGFPNRDPLTAVVANGSFLNNTQITPSVGFMRHGLLDERAKRRKYGLPAELRPPKLEDDSARRFNELAHDSDWVASDITVSTDADQTPIAPGRTLSDTGLKTDPDARRTVHFRSDAPINQFFSIQSGRYEIRRAAWHAPAQPGQPAAGADLAVYYQPGHEFNVDRMLDAMGKSLTLFSTRFSPYQFGQARIIEFPAYATFAQSFANTIPFSEGIGFVQHFTDPTKIDVATYVTAHEVGHQWWGHQLVPADQQGASMLVESFAQYSALLTMEQMYGRDQVRRFLKYELDSYLRMRGGAVLEELPLARVENQDYIYYRKGSLVMYWAKEALGEEVVDRALRRLLAQYAFKGAPYANTTDFLRILRAEAGPGNDALITDLFEKITLLDLKATHARATKRPDGKYDLSFDVEAKKFYADGAGRQTEAPMDERVDLGVFGAAPGSAAFKAGDVLVLEKKRIESGVHSVSMVVDRAPAWVGIDPYNKRIDRNSDDNLTKVDLR